MVGFCALKSPGKKTSQQKKARFCCATGSIAVKGEDVSWTWKSPRSKSSSQPEWMMFCLCDGHGGSEAAHFIKDNLISHLHAELPKWKPSSWCSYEVADFAFEICEAICRSIEGLENLWRTMSHSAGSTFTLAIVCDQFMTIANVGDSYAFLDCDTTLIEVTHSHRLDDNDYEVERILQHGDTLARISRERKGGPAPPGTSGVGALRVWPTGLSMGRSFGDHDAPVSVTSRPHFKQMVLPDAGCRLIMATDGVWDMLNSEEVWNLTKKSDVENAVRHILDRLVIRSYGNPQDDATAMIIDFSPFAACKKKQIENKQDHLVPSFFCELDSLDIFPDPNITSYNGISSSPSSSCRQVHTAHKDVPAVVFI